MVHNALIPHGGNRPVQARLLATLLPVALKMALTMTLTMAILLVAGLFLPLSLHAQKSTTKRTPVKKAAIKRTAVKRSAVKTTPIKASARKTLASNKLGTNKRVVQTRYTAGNRVALRKTSYTRFRQRTSPYAGFWTVPNFADATDGDVIDGEDLTVRRAAVEALNGLNGSVVVVDPSNGRILTMVNQKLALQNGFQPCSTIKILASVAGVMEGEYDKDKVQKLGRREYMNMTTALARSNNPYFANIGRKLGYEKISYYAKLLGLGETAGLNIPGEQPGIWPGREVPSGIGMMTSFGDGINLTPLQLASQLTMIANGGTMYYLQYPRTPADIEAFVPQVKRRIPNIEAAISELKPGMQGAIEFGSARRAGYEDHEPIYGKTGTCTHSDHQTHLGWFGSFNEVGDRKLVVVVLLTGGKLVSGPIASGVAGQVFLKLKQNEYFATAPALWSPNAMLAGSSASLTPEN
jgi:beta-lactamase class D